MYCFILQAASCFIRLNEGCLAVVVGIPDEVVGESSPYYVKVVGSSPPRVHNRALVGTVSCV